MVGKKPVVLRKIKSRLHTRKSINGENKFSEHLLLKVRRAEFYEFLQPVGLKLGILRIDQRALGSGIPTLRRQQEKQPI